MYYEYGATTKFNCFGWHWIIEKQGATNQPLVILNIEK